MYDRPVAATYPLIPFPSVIANRSMFSASAGKPALITISSLLLFYVAKEVFNYLVESPLRDPASLNKPSTFPIAEGNLIGTNPAGTTTREAPAADPSRENLEIQAFSNPR